MSTRESITFAENLTLVVMDLEPGTGVVWLELRDDGVPLKSSVLRTGESFAYDERGDGLNLTVARIYAGGERDLVDLEVFSGEVVGVGGQEGARASVEDGGRTAVEGDSSLTNWGLFGLIVLLLAYWIYFWARPRGR